MYSFCPRAAPCQGPLIPTSLACAGPGAVALSQRKAPVLAIRRHHERPTLTARTPGHDDAAEYPFTAADHQSANRTVKQTLRETDPDRFQRAAIAAVAATGSDDDLSPAHRRFVSQSLDLEAVRRGLLLRAHWHCPQCGAPGSQWTPGCLRTVCGQPAPDRLAHWDLCRIASADELLTLMVSEGYARIGRGRPRHPAAPPAVRPHRLTARVPTRAGPPLNALGPGGR